MRLIDQEKLKDVPYDGNTVRIEGTKIFVGVLLMGIYETSERAKEVMVDLRNSYCSSLGIVSYPVNNGTTIKQPKKTYFYFPER